MSAFMGKPDAPKPAPPPFRAFRVDLNDSDDGPDEVPANYFRWTDGLVSFWEERDGKPFDYLVVAYPLNRIQSITEEQ